MWSARWSSALPLLLTGCVKFVFDLGDPYVAHEVPPGHALVELYRVDRDVGALMPVHVVVAGRERILVNDGYAVIPVPPGTHLVTATLGGTVFVPGGVNAPIQAPASMGDAAVASGAPVDSASVASLYRSDASIAMSTAQLNAMGAGPAGTTEPLATWTMYGTGQTWTGPPASTPLTVAAGERAVIRVEGGITKVKLSVGDPEELHASRLCPGGVRPAPPP